jgi:hypothetical protein
MRYLSLILFMGVLFSCRTDKRYHNVSENIEVLQDSSSAYNDALIFQKKMNREFKDPETSPLKDKDRKNFESLNFFPIDTTYRVTAKFIETPNQSPFLMPTTTNRLPEYIKYGEAHFTLKGKEFVLTIYQNQQLTKMEEYEDYLFLPFTDATNGKETYGGGRYIDARIPEGNTVVIDFNKAYNPYCAYNEKYSCPIVPAENTLSIAVKAGVKKFKD